VRRLQDLHASHLGDNLKTRAERGVGRPVPTDDRELHIPLVPRNRAVDRAAPLKRANRFWQDRQTDPAATRLTIVYHSLASVTNVGVNPASWHMPVMAS
jgi:hypothetical protein